MKNLIVGMMFMFCFQSNSLWSQIAPANYRATYDLSNSFIEYKLALESDQSFTFHFYRKNECERCVEENKYGKGTWSLDGKSLVLSINAETDIDDKYILDLHNSKARLLQKQNTKDKTVQLLKFYESDLFWVKGLELQAVR